MYSKLLQYSSVDAPAFPVFLSPTIHRADLYAFLQYEVRLNQRAQSPFLTRDIVRHLNRIEVDRLAVRQKDNHRIRSSLPEEIRGSEIRKRRCSATAAEGESRLLMRADHRRGRRKCRRAVRAVARAVSLIDGGAGRRFALGLTRFESQTGSAARGPGALAPVEGAQRGCWRRRARQRRRRLVRRDGDRRRGRRRG